MPKDPYGGYEGEPPEQEFEPDTLVIADQSLKLGFIQLPKLVLYARNLTRDAKLLYAILLGYAWQQGRCFPGYSRLCYDMGASENTVRVYMRELEKVGLLQQKRRGLGKTNIYILLDLRTAKIEVQEPQNARPAKIEVQEPPETTAPEHKKTAGELETEELETDRQETGIYSNETHSNRSDSKHQGGRLSTTVRGRSIVDNPAAGEGPADDPAPTGWTHLAEVVRALRPRAAADGPAPAASRRGRPPKADYIATVMEEISTRLHDDPKHVRSNITRATRLWQASGLDERAFVEQVLYQARSLAQAQGNVTKRAGDGTGLRNKVPYFFAVAEDLLGLRERRDA